MITYTLEPDLSAAEFVDVLRRSTLAERRPVDDMGRVDRMLRGANLILTARADTRLIGVARSITDFAYCLYLSDLAVDEAWQGRGVGQELLRRTKAAVGEGVSCWLVSAPKAVSFYERIGLERPPAAFKF